MYSRHVCLQQGQKGKGKNKDNRPDSQGKQAPVVRKLDSAIHRINRYPAVKYYDNQLRYPVDSDLSSG